MKSQGKCGSCVAFSTAVTVETCFKKVTGVFGDYSEQHMVDCAYGYKGAGGCNGAATHSYTDWLGDKKIKLASEAQYPYKIQRGTCPANPPSFNQVNTYINLSIDFTVYFLITNHKGPVF